MIRKGLWSAAILSLGILIVVVSWLVVTAQRQKMAAQKIRRFGGSVDYETMSLRSGKPVPIRVQLLSRMTNYIDADLLMPITYVRSQYKSGAKYTPAEFIRLLPMLPSVQSVVLSHCAVENDDLAPLLQLPALESLSLGMTKLREGPLPGLAPLKLKWLSLLRTRINDESLESLQHMSSLEYLDLTRTKVTDDGLRHLDHLPNLKKLVLRRCLVTEKGYRAFAKKHPAMDVSWEPLKPISAAAIR